MLQLYRRLTTLRRAEPALAVGKHESLAAGEDVVAYLRHEAGSQFLVLLNLGSQARSFRAAEVPAGGHIALSTHLDRDNEPVGRDISLRPDEGVVIGLPPRP